MTQNETSTLTPDAMIAQLRAMRQQIPQYVQLTTKQSRSLGSAASVSPEMVNAAANAIGESAAVQSSVGTSVEEIRAMSADATVWEALEAELAATHRGVASANLQRRHQMGSTALIAYAVSRALIRHPEHSGLLPHVADMRRSFRAARSRKGSDTTPNQQQSEAKATTQ